MDRLTGLFDAGKLWSEVQRKKSYASIYRKLQEYEDDEEQGLLLRLPCKVGDTIFVVPSKVNYDLNVLNGYGENNRVYRQRVHSIQMFDNDTYLLVTCEGHSSVLASSYKVTWFLTKEEAERELERIKNNV